MLNIASFFKKIAKWLDNNILTLLTAILIVVIPLYPKLPLADLIEGYIVRLRLEDVLILVTIIIYLLQLLRRKVHLPKGLIPKLLIGYVIVGLLSSISALVITHTVPLEQQHIFKLFLHLARRVEYFSLFFIAYAGVRSKRDLRLFCAIGFATLIAVVLYGFGQKYLYWPAFSTMNREFSKGIRLYLTPESRVMSTFGGHYDYGAYLMMALTLLATAFWLTKKFFVRVLLLLVGTAAYWSLILTASRTSFLGYMGGLTIVAFLLAGIKGRLRMFAHWLVAIVVSLTVMLTLGDLSTRFFQILESPDILVHEITQVTPLKRDSVEKTVAQMQDTLLTFKTSLANLKLSVNNPFNKKPPKNAISTEQLASTVTTPTDTLPTPSKPPVDLPPDVSPEEDLLRQQMEASLAAALAATPAATPVANTSGYSPNALRYGLSVAIRLDALWPRAVAGFMRNPLLGSGYSTLTKGENEEFTQAESTDNDYLRMLGETGILGTGFFFAILIALTYLSLRYYREARDPLTKLLMVGLVGSIVALLINATYIDIFESSKVAYTLWLLAALVVRARELEGQDHVKTT